MSEKNEIYEITQKISNTAVVRNDMNEATELVMQMFKEKYFNRLQSAISDHHAHCRQNPSKEVQFLHALKPFLPGGQEEKMDKLIQFMLLRDTADRVNKELSINSIPYPKADGKNAPPASKSPAVNAAELPSSADSIHEDGIYDVDQGCLNRKRQGASEFPGILFAMMLMMKG